MPEVSTGGSAVRSEETPATSEPAVRARGDREIKQARERRLVKIESLRAVLALGVLTAHIYVTARGNVFTAFGSRIIPGTGFGAYVFFALSGCLLYIPFVRRDFGGGTISHRNYALNRAVRVLPLYYVALIAVLVILHNGGTLKQWVIFGLFGENFFYETVGTLNGALWTGVIEFHFYLLLPFLAYAIARLSGGSLNRAMLILGALIVGSFLLQLFLVLLEARPYRDPVRMSLPTHFYFIGAGMMVALVREAWRQRPPRLWEPLRSANLWLALAILPWLALTWNFKLQAVFAIGCFLILGAFVLPLRPSVLDRVLEWRPLAAFGLTSYSLYIWQAPILVTINRRHVPVLDPLIANAQDLLGSRFLGMWVIAAPFCCAVAVVSYKLIEEPALRLRRRWGAERSTRVEKARTAETPAPAAPAGETAAS
jgi:peptidoglycan/LPS O-acetylase OafA/YrhL